MSASGRCPPRRRAAPLFRSGRSWARRQMAGSGGKRTGGFGCEMLNGDTDTHRGDPGPDGS
jgi:hypothetical protein